jgi:NADH-quinone oxidoreductase subunit L
VVGFTNIPGKLAPDSFELRFEHYVEPTFAFPTVVHPEFSWVVALTSTVLALAGIFLAWQYYAHDRGPHGLTQRSRLAARGYAFLENKYYLDWLYEKVIRDGIKGPIARGAYWFNQHVLDGVVNGASAVARGTGTFLYKYIDQGGIDRAVNASGAGAEGSGQLLRHIQTGRVQQYAALLFAGAAVLAGIFIVII